MSMLQSMKPWVLGQMSPLQLINKLFKLMNSSKVLDQSLEMDSSMVVLEMLKIQEQLLYQLYVKMLLKKKFKNS